MSDQPLAQAVLDSEQYKTTARVLEQALEAGPDDIENYLKLGIIYLLLGKEEEAQASWLYGISQADEETIPYWNLRLIKLLDAEAYQQAEQNQIQVSLLLRQHLKELAPDWVSNLLSLIDLKLQLHEFIPELITEYRLNQFIEKFPNEDINHKLLFKLFPKLLEFPCVEVLALVDACLNRSDFVAELVALLYDCAYEFVVIRSTEFEFAISLLERVTKFEPDHASAWGILSGCYRRLERYEESIKAAQQNMRLSKNLGEKYSASCALEITYLKAGLWHCIEPILAQNHELLQTLLTQQPTNLDLPTISCLISDPAHLLYLKDNLADNRRIQNQAANIFYQNFCKHTTLKPCKNNPQPANSNRPLRIGFIGHSLYAHSVGWLSRWLFKYLDNNAFQTFVYLVMTEPADPFVQRWLTPYVYRVHGCTEDLGLTIEKIVADQIDILIDLEGQTLSYACCVLSLKPAPIQATWLGWDASGLPSVDYFIADPYVLPDNAQEHYQENIWRLPDTYIAVEGFEADVPNLRRDDLKISTDAIVYLSCQDSCKRNPENIRLQMQIIKEVPNSYFLIKGQSHTPILQDLFCEIAEDVGVSPEQLRFLPQAPSELVHRANLQIADVVLDTFPYNGATTTLETLWMGIPVVTRAGEQFTARYGYTLLTNAGLREGIAWSDQEYVDWGIRYGADANLRLQVTHKLRQARHVAPLWNAKRFAREMENAFRQMWQIYTTSAAL